MGRAAQGGPGGERPGLAVWAGAGATDSQNNKSIRQSDGKPPLPLQPFAGWFASVAFPPSRLLLPANVRNPPSAAVGLRRLFALSAWGAGSARVFRGACGGTPASLSRGPAAVAGRGGVPGSVSRCRFRTPPQADREPT